MANQNELLGAAFCKGKLSLGSKPHPQRALAQESSASRFPPRPCALHRAMRGWAAPGSLGPAALLGLSGTRITLPTGSPSWGCRIGRAKAFCTQTTAMHPEPARPLSTEAPSQRRPKTSFWELHSAKGNSPWQQTTAPTPSTLESTAIRFRHRPSALHRAQLSWATPGSLGPAALLGLSGTRITLPTGSPSWGSRIGRAKAFCAQAPAMPPEPAPPLSAESPSNRRP